MQKSGHLRYIFAHYARNDSLFSTLHNLDAVLHRLYNDGKEKVTPTSFEKTINRLREV